MRRRAHDLGAKLAITPSPAGTTLSLSIPRAL
jgi:signal transduction histidine kinase